MKAKFYSVLVLLIAALTFPTAVVQAQPTGSKGGKFTVASGKQVRFSQGNLQFNVSQGTHQTADGSQAGTWRFAENQYDTIGRSNTNIIVENYTGWISLFGWGTSGYNDKSPMMYVYDNAQYGVGTSDIAGTNYDWGVYNAISNGGNKPGLWRTPTREEYSYMLKNRANAEKLWSRCEVNGIDGFIFLPDDWTLPAGITFTPKAHYYDNVYTIEQWTQLENNGAIFIPKEGRQNYSTSNLRMEYTTGSHYVATSSCKSTSQRYVLSGSQTDPTGTSCSTFRYMGVPVRLVRTVEEFTVTFKNWDGTTLKSENVEYGFAATPPTDLVREGWTFTGWTASVSGMSKDYITDEVTFTAQYEKYITYTVTFVDGATNEIIKTETVKKGENATAPTVPSHLGWTFTGWDKSFTNVQADLVVTAQYTWDETDGRLNGKFSVAAGKQVYFAKGNLRYQPSNNRWRFAGYQYDWAGVDANTHVGESDYDEWIDLFGWSNTANNFGVTAGWDGNEFSGVFVDWGDNPIENGGNKQYAWYTLTSAEWDYLFNTRTDAASKYSFGTVNGLRGMIILPDSWTKPSSISFTAKATSYDTNTYSANQWELLEANGAVFLPQTGDREETIVVSYGSTVMGMYRVGNPGGTRQDANVLLWMKSGNSYYIDAASGQPEYKGYSVRLARPVQMCSKTSSFTASAIGSYAWEGRVYTTSGAFTRNFRTAQGCDSVVTMVLTITQEQPAEGTGLLSGLFSVSADHQAQFSQGNLQYQPLTNSWRFATNQYDLIGPDNSHITEAAYGGWIDLFAWSCTGNNDYGIMRNLDSYTISGDFVDWGNNAVLNGGNRPHFWQTLSVEEWEYILTERANADNLWGCATVNTVHGVILLPDSWTTPAGLTFVSASEYYTSNSYTPAQWAQMESAGAVFLPATGSYGIWPTLYVDGSNQEGLYFSADKHLSEGAYYGMGAHFYNSGNYATGPYIYEFMRSGSVRLVRMGECVAKTTSITETRCDSYVWDGTTYTESGDYQKSYITSTGCDSIVTLRLTINKSYETGFGEQAETSYTWQGTTYTESGDYTKTLQTVAGCDSIVTLHLTIGSDELDDPEDPEQKWANGVLPGKFSVSADKQVHFSQGNLQYKASDAIWRFAPNQTDTIGSANSNISASYSGWIDLFGWGTGNNPTNSSQNDADYAAFTDWGTNAISNGGNEADIWRTLSQQEWEYLFRGRANAESLLVAGSVNGVGGCIVLPDDWEAPEEITFNPISTHASWDESKGKYQDPAICVMFNRNSFTATEWTKMEAAGAIFLPGANGQRVGQDWERTNWSRYWTASLEGEEHIYGISLDDCGFYLRQDETGGWGKKHMGCSVRLVQDITSDEPCTDKTSEFSASAETSYTWEGTTYTESGDYTKTFPMTNGCDSIVTLHLTITDIVIPCEDKTSEFSETAEGSYTWNGTVYDESGDYTQTFPMANGCDSIVTLHLTITHAATDCMSIETFVDEQPAYDVTFCPLTVLYANNKSTWVVAESGKAVQIYDNKKTYLDGTDTKGTVLNGVRGYYSNYKEQAEIIPVAAPESKETTTLIPTPKRIEEDMLDSYLHDANNFPYWYQRYVELHNATVILNNNKYYAWNNDIQVYNPYQFALTEGEGKNLIGVLTKFNDQVQLYLLEDAKDYDPIQDVTTWTVVTTDEIKWQGRTMPCANYEPCPAMDMTQVSDGIYQLQTYCSYISMANTANSYPYWVVGKYNENIYRYPDLSQESQYINAAEIGIGLYNFTFTFDTNGPRLTLDWTPSTVFTVEGTSNWLDSEFDPTDTNNDMQCDPTGAWWQKFTQSENTDIETLFGAPAEDLYVLLKENVRLESWVTYHFNFVGYHDRAIWQLDYNPMEGVQLGVTEDGNYNVLFYFIPKYMYGYVIVEPARSNGLSDPSAVVLRPRKVIEDNSVIIIMPDGRRYNVLGTQVKQ